MTLSDLIAMLEQATGPSRELDGEIAKTMLGWKLWRSKHGYWHVDAPGGEQGFSMQSCEPYGPRFDPDTGKKNPDYDKEPTSWVEDAGIPEFTRSIDAALTLVPEGYVWQVRNHVWTSRVSAGYETCGNAYLFSIPGHRPKGDIGECHGATVPIALCIASLKARQAGA